MTQTDPNVEQKQGFEELQVMGEQLVTKVKELVHEGNIRRIIIKQDGNTIVEFPLNIGIVGAILAPSVCATPARDGVPRTGLGASPRYRGVSCRGAAIWLRDAIGHRD